MRSAAVGERVPEEPRGRAELHVTPLGLGRHLAAGARRVGLVHVDGHAVVAAQSLGEADVVGVAVGEHDAADVVDRAAHRGQFGGEVAPVPREARVDERDAVGGVDQVHGDDVVADSVQGWAESHRSSSLSQSVGRL